MFTADVSYLNGTDETLKNWIREASPEALTHLKWILKSLDALEQRGHTLGAFKDRGAWDVYCYAQGGYQVLYRFRRVAPLKLKAEVVDAFIGPDSEADARASMWTGAD